MSNETSQEELRQLYQQRLSSYEQVRQGIHQIVEVVVTKGLNGKFSNMMRYTVDPLVTLEEVLENEAEMGKTWQEIGYHQSVRLIGATTIQPLIDEVQEKLLSLDA